MIHRAKYERLLKNSKGQYRYQFNWVSGGFNDVWAKNLKEFKVELNRQFGNSNLDVDYKTLHKATESGARSWDKAGNMLCW
jgi:hypothetical protein